MAGGLLSILVKKTSRSLKEATGRNEKGIIFASGLVAGDALVAVIVAFVIYMSDSYRGFYEGFESVSVSGQWGDYISLATFGLLMIIFWQMTRGWRKSS